jgi:glycosyltransferase involved in cell wall biosynthesis
VILPCYKTGQFIGEALESVGVQTYTNWEVIAVDDCGPEDGTRGAVEAFAAKFPDHRILYHRHKLNAGVSAARNTGIRAARVCGCGAFGAGTGALGGA